QELTAKAAKRQMVAQEHSAEMLQKTTPIVTVDKNSLSVSGYGLPIVDARSMPGREFQCQNGRLYCASINDYNQRYYYFAWDPSYTFAQALKQQQDDLAPYFSMKSMTPDL